MITNSPSTSSHPLAMISWPFRRSWYINILKTCAIVGLLVKLYVLVWGSSDSRGAHFYDPNNRDEQDQANLLSAQDRIFAGLRDTRRDILTKYDQYLDKQLAKPLPQSDLPPEPLVLISIYSGHEQVGGPKDPLFQQAMRNRENFVARHTGFVHHFVDLSTSAPSTTKFTRVDGTVSDPGWLKLQVIRDAFKSYPNCEWFWILDLDALIMNLNFDLHQRVLNSTELQNYLLHGLPLFYNHELSEDRIYPMNVKAESVELILSQNWNGFDLASFLIKSSPFTDNLLDQWEIPLRMGLSFSNHEKGALQELALYDKNIMSRIGIVPRRLFASHQKRLSTKQKPYSRYHSGDLAVIFDRLEASPDKQSFESLWSAYHELHA